MLLKTVHQWDICREHRSDLTKLMEEQETAKA